MVPRRVLPVVRCTSWAMTTGGLDSSLRYCAPMTHDPMHDAETDAIVAELEKAGLVEGAGPVSIRAARPRARRAAQRRAPKEWASERPLAGLAKGPKTSWPAWPPS
jgi:hypothetical protein